MTPSVNGTFSAKFGLSRLLPTTTLVVALLLSNGPRCAGELTSSDMDVQSGSSVLPDESRLVNPDRLGSFARWNEEETRHVTKTDLSEDFKALFKKKSNSTNPTGGQSLNVQVYRVLRDAAIIDWTISLAEKDTLFKCQILYKANGNEAILSKPFLPKTRTFLLQALLTHTNYTFIMTCIDHNGDSHITKTVPFTTGKLGSPSYLNRINRKSIPNGEVIGYLTDLELNFGASAPLAAISSSVVGNSVKVSSGNNQKYHSIKRSSSSQRSRMSPHTVLGASCAVVGFIIVSITVGLAFRRYRNHRHSQSHLWELQAAQQELECSAPTFISLPPPYTEEPSPLYSLMASSVSSTTVGTTSSCCEPSNNNFPAQPVTLQCCNSHQQQLIQQSES